MKPKIFALITCIMLIALLIFTLSACQLARADGDINAAREDRLIGFVVTTEYLDLFDFESYFNDNVNSFTGGEITMNGDSGKYQGRIYAELMTQTLTSEETGETIETEEYRFTDVDGMAYFCPTMTGENGSYHASIGDPSVSDVQLAIHAGDTTQGITIEGTIYFTAGNGNVTFYMNPVYQSQDGSVYLMAGSGMSTNASEGMEMSTYMESTNTVTENGESLSDSSFVKVTYKCISLPEKIVLYEMDAENVELSKKEYAPGELPESLVPNEETEYIIVVTHKRDSEGAAYTSHEIYGRDAEAFDTFRTREDGICEKYSTQITWYAAA